MRKIRAVAWYEFIGAVTRLGYLLTLVGMPLFVGCLIAVTSLISVRSARESLSRKRTIGIVDESGMFPGIERLEADLPKLGRLPAVATQKPRPIELRHFPSLADAHAALQRDEVASIVRIPPDYLSSGKLQEYVGPKRELDLSSGQLSSGALLRPYLVRGLLEGRVDPAIAARAAEAPHIERMVIDAGGSTSPADLIREIRPLVIPIGFGMLLVLCIFTSASYLATGLAEEKQNRALELLLTSLSPAQLFWGKLLGLWMAALLQFVLYLLAVAVPAGFAFAALGLNAVQALVGACYFVLGFFFFAAVLLTVGAIGNTHKYTQQLSAMFTLTGIAPMMVVTSLLSQPKGALARTLTYIPFTAPLTGLLRFGADALPWWEFAVSLLVLTIGTGVVIWVCARIFRVALLSSGTTPSFGQLWQWLRTG